MDEAGVKKDTLGGRRLAGVNVRGNADVAGAFEGVFAVGRIRGFSFSAHLKSIWLIDCDKKNAPASYRRGEL
jgi:hypothetical protein